MKTHKHIPVSSVFVNNKIDHVVANKIKTTKSSNFIFSNSTISINCNNVMFNYADVNHTYNIGFKLYSYGTLSFVIEGYSIFDIDKFDLSDYESELEYLTITEVCGDDFLELFRTAIEVMKNNLKSKELINKYARV